MHHNPEMTLQFVCPKTQKPLPVPSERGSVYVADGIPPTLLAEVQS
jgi:hypothetical protein